MLHTNKGRHKILDECTLPLTAAGKVDTIVTELAVMKVTEEGLRLVEYHESTNVEDVQTMTGAKLIIDDNVKIWRD